MKSTTPTNRRVTTPKATRTKPSNGSLKSSLRPKAARADVHPFHLKKILVPMDLSEISLKALQYALPFARQFGAEITLLHVVTPPVYPQEFGYTGMSEIEQRDDAKRRLSRVAKANVPADINVVKTVAIGIASAEIVDAAKKLQTDLIIATTHGYTGLKHVMLGSTAERVIRHAPCPVLIVRKREHELV